jgi:hypothetical protein
MYTPPPPHSLAQQQQQPLQHPADLFAAFWKEIRGSMEGLRSDLSIGLYMLPYKIEDLKRVRFSFFLPLTLVDSHLLIFW